MSGPVSTSAAWPDGDGRGDRESASRGHLGDRLAALVDGQLDHVDRDRVLAHLTRCASCRAEAAEQRAVKARLDRVAVRPPGSLEGRLLALAPPGPWGPAPGALPLRAPAAWSPPTPAWPVPAGPAGPAAPRGRGALRRVPLSVTAGLLAVGAGLVALGGESADLPQRDPGLPGLVVEHASTTTQMPLVDAGAVGVTWGSATAGRVASGPTVPVVTATAVPGWSAVSTGAGGRAVPRGE